MAQTRDSAIARGYRDGEDVIHTLGLYPPEHGVTAYTDTAAAATPTSPNMGVILCATTDCYVLFAATGNAAAGTSFLLPAYTVFQTPFGNVSRVSVVRVDTSGSLFWVTVPGSSA